MSVFDRKNILDDFFELPPKTSFFVCLIGGLFGLIVSAILENQNIVFNLLFPVIFTVIFCVYSWKKSDSLSASRSSLGDGCYYLGFLFTLSGVAVVLYLMPAKSTSVGTLVQNFGAAVMTTIIGMSMRVYLVNFHRNLEDIQNRMENELLEATQTFISNIDNSVTQFKILDQRIQESHAEFDKSLNERTLNFSKEFQQKLELLISEINVVIKGSLTENQNQLQENLKTSISDLMKQLSSELTTITSVFAEPFEKSNEETTAHLNKFNSILEEGNEKIKKVLDQYNRNLSTKFKSSNNNLEKLNNVLEEVEKSEDGLAEKVDQFNEHFLEIQRSSLEFTTALKEHKAIHLIDKMDTSLEKFTVSLERIVKQQDEFLSEVKNIQDNQKALNKTLSELAQEEPKRLFKIFHK
jgi:archaellum component FlaC